MEAEKIISTLKEQVGTTDFSDRTIGVYVENNPLAEGVEPDEEYFKKGVTFLKSLQGQYNADFSSKLNAKVEEFKKNYKPETLKKPEQNGGNETDIEARLKAIQEAQDAKIKEFEKKYAEKEKAIEQKSYVAQLESAFKTKLEGEGLIYDSIYFENIIQKSGEFDTTKPISEAIKGISEKYDKMFKDRNRSITSNSFMPNFQTEVKPGAGGKSPAELFKERQIAQGRLPKEKTEK